MLKGVYIVLGFLFVGLAALGVLLPVLPTTPFLLLSIWLFARCSPRLKQWLLTNPVFGRYISDFYNGEGVPRRVKFYTLALLWSSIIYAAIWVVNPIWLKTILFVIAIGVTIHILRFKTKQQQ